MAAERIGASMAYITKRISNSSSWNDEKARGTKPCLKWRKSTVFDLSGTDPPPTLDCPYSQETCPGGRYYSFTHGMIVQMSFLFLSVADAFPCD